MLRKIFTEEDEERARQIRIGEDRLPGTQRFLSKDRWVGKLGQWAFAEFFPEFVDMTKDYIADDYDFISSSGEKIEVKTTGSNAPYRSWYSFVMDAHQFEENHFDMLVRCHYWKQEKELTIIGYSDKHNLENTKIPYSKGETIFNKFGKPTFVALNDCYVWESDKFLSIDVL